MNAPQVGIIMGSKSDLDIMTEAAKILEEFGIEHEVRVLSAHRTPDEAAEYVKTAKDRGLKLIIAGAGGSAHLAGVAAAHTYLPVLSIPIKRQGHDHEALFSNIMMPPGVPLAVMPENGGKNTGLMAVAILSLTDDAIEKKYADYRKKESEAVKDTDKKLQEEGWRVSLEE